ncbi:MAG: hypothetical protein ABIM74_00765 [candidate division WOR-3 bacterium]
MILLLLSQITMSCQVLNPRESYYSVGLLGEDEPLLVAITYKNTGDSTIYLAAWPYGFVGAVLGSPCIIAQDAKGNEIPWTSPVRALYVPTEPLPHKTMGIYLHPGESLISVDNVLEFLDIRKAHPPITLLGVKYSGIYAGKPLCEICWDGSAEAYLTNPFVFSLDTAKPSEEEFYRTNALAWSRHISDSITAATAFSPEEKFRLRMAIGYRSCKRILAIEEAAPYAYYFLLYLLVSNYWTMNPSVLGYTPYALLDSLRAEFPDHPYLSDEYWWWLPRIIDYKIEYSESCLKNPKYSRYSDIFISAHEWHNLMKKEGRE